MNQEGAEVAAAVQVTKMPSKETLLRWIKLLKMVAWLNPLAGTLVGFLEMLIEQLMSAQDAATPELVGWARESVGAIDFSKIKQAAEALLPMLEWIAGMTATTYDDDFVAFLRGMLSAPTVGNRVPV